MNISLTADLNEGARKGFLFFECYIDVCVNVCSLKVNEQIVKEKECNWLPMSAHTAGGSVGEALREVQEEWALD